MPDAYQERVWGIRIKEGIFYHSGSLPFAKVTLYRDKIVMSLLFSSSEVQKKQIKSIRKVKFNVVFDVIEIIGKGGEFFQIRPFDIENFVKKLKEFGYKVR